MKPWGICYYKSFYKQKCSIELADIFINMLQIMHTSV